MNKQQFLDALRRGLSQLPEEEIEKQLSYYSELIDDMLEDGMTEYEATARLGSVQEIYENILQEMPLPLLVRTRTKPKGGWSALTVILAIISFPIWFTILAVLFAAVVTVYALIWVLAILGFVIVFVIVVSALAFLVFFVRMLLAGGIGALLALGLALLLAGAAIAAALLAVAFCKLIIKASVWIGRKVKSLFIRKEG